MIEFIPYFAGIVTVLFSIAFSYAITDGWNFKDKGNN
jgi:putative flippase GtrA